MPISKYYKLVKRSPEDFDIIQVTEANLPPVPQFEFAKRPVAPKAAAAKPAANSVTIEKVGSGIQPSDASQTKVGTKEKIETESPKVPAAVKPFGTLGQPSEPGVTDQMNHVKAGTMPKTEGKKPANGVETRKDAATKFEEKKIVDGIEPNKAGGAVSIAKVPSIGAMEAAKPPATKQEGKRPAELQAERVEKNDNPGCRCAVL